MKNSTVVCRMERWLKSYSSCVLFSSRMTVDGSYDRLSGFQKVCIIDFEHREIQSNHLIT